MRAPAFSIPLPVQLARRLNRPVEGLLLDSCNTLYDATGWRRWLLQMLRRLGVRTSYDCFFHVWEKDYLDAVHRGQVDLCNALRSFLRALGLTQGQIEEVATTCHSRRRRWEAETRLLPGVKRTLRQIAAAGVPLAVVSNTEHSGPVLREWLEGMGLRDTLSATVTSRDLGCTKPDALCFTTALEALGIHAPQAAFVGHEPDELRAAAQLGMQTIAINPTGNVKADVLMVRFSELLELVDPPSCRSAAG